MRWLLGSLVQFAAAWHATGDDDVPGQDRMQNISTVAQVHNLGKLCVDHTMCGAPGIGACCRLGYNVNDESCDFGRAGCDHDFCCARASHDIEPDPLVENEGEQCFEACNSKTGACPSRCGSGGACCRAGFGANVAECNFGEAGCSDSFCCVAASRTVRISIPTLLSSSVLGAERTSEDPCLASGGVFEDHSANLDHGDICRLERGYACPATCRKMLKPNGIGGFTGTKPFCSPAASAATGIGNNLPCRYSAPLREPVTTDSRLCAHDKFSDARFTPPTKPVPPWVPAKGGEEIIDGLVGAALAPWLAPQGGAAQRDAPVSGAAHRN